MGLFEKVLATAFLLLLVTMPLAAPLATVQRWRLWRVAIAWGVALAVTAMVAMAYAVLRLLASIWGLA